MRRKLGHLCTTCPDQHTAVLIHREVFGINEVIFECFQVLVIKLELELEGTVRDTALAVQELADLRPDSREVHQRPSTCVSTDSAWGSPKESTIA